MYPQKEKERKKIMEISKVDKNFELPSFDELGEIEWYSIKEAPIDVYGTIIENGHYSRMPEAVAKNISEGVKSLALCTAGGRAKFSTDSPFLALWADLPEYGHMPHITSVGHMGFDVYRNNSFIGAFMPDIMNKKMQGVVNFCDKRWYDEKMHYFTMHLPLYCGLNDAFIGIKKGAKLASGTPYENIAPIVYYGSSITQGGCASRPGTCYQNIITRRTNVNHINLGFSGNAKGETQMAEYIAGLDMSIFVYDYDHNANSVEWLQNTHERFFRIIRDAKPDVPVIFISRPMPGGEFANDERKQIIYNTYKTALNNGDKNVRFIDGSTLFEGLGYEDCTVDYIHPTDLGFFGMANKIGAVIDEFLSKK